MWPSYVRPKLITADLQQKWIYDERSEYTTKSMHIFLQRPPGRSCECMTVQWSLSIRLCIAAKYTTWIMRQVHWNTDLSSTVMSLRAVLKSPELIPWIWCDDLHNFLWSRSNVSSAYHDQEFKRPPTTDVVVLHTTRTKFIYFYANTNYTST
jgi:hypothetical protein